MASTYSTNLAIELIGTGDQAGSWGNTTNTNLGTLIEQAISGYVTQAVSTGTDTTITIPNGATGVARNMYIELTGTGGTNTNLIVPANKKLYFIFNNTSSGQVTVKVSGQTGISVPNGKKMVLVSNGTDVVVAENYIADFGSNSATITNLTCTSLTLSNNPTFSGGTANGVAYLNGSKVLTSGTALVFDGTNLGIGTSTPSKKLDIRANVVGESALALISNDNASGTGGSPTVASIEFASAGVAKASIAAAVYGNDWLSFRTGSNTERMRLTSSVLSTDSSINVGIGTASPGEKLNVLGGGATTSTVNFTGGAAGNDNATIASDYSLIFQVDANNSIGGRVFNWRYGGKGYTDGTSLMLLDSSGSLGLGVTPSAWGGDFKAIQVGSNGAYITGRISNRTLYIGTNNYFDGSNFIYTGTAAASLYTQNTGAHEWYTNSNTPAAGNPISFTQAMTLDASGNLGIGTTSPGNFSGTVKLVVGSAATTTTAGAVTVYSGTATYGGLYFADGTVGDQLYRGAVEYNHSTDALLLYSAGAERARITSGGDLLVGMTSTSDSATGAYIQAGGGGYFGRAAGTPLIVNRKTDDGTLVAFYQDSSTEGSISVSGNTVSYNAFAGSHWSQLQDGSKPDILRGTVMESINELCVWPGEQNERLPKSKVSDTAGSKKVYGVFMAWDNDWATTNDMYITAVGAFICRVNGSVTVQEGDLLESNGDGTARVQADDIIRNSTIGKVTSTVKTHEYDDGSYCVPTVLYCG